MNLYIQVLRSGHEVAISLPHLLEPIRSKMSTSISIFSLSVFLLLLLLRRCQYHYFKHKWPQDGVVADSNLAAVVD